MQFAFSRSDETRSLVQVYSSYSTLDHSVQLLLTLHLQLAC